MVKKKSRWQDSRVSEQDDDRSGDEKPDDPIETIEASETTAPSEEAQAEEAPAAPEADDLPVIPIKVFAKIAGPKWDQMAGFLHHSKIKNIGPRTVPAWRATYQAFLRKPVK